VVRCTETCHDWAQGQRGLRLELAPAAPRVLAPRDLTYMDTHEPRLTWCNTWGASAKWCKIVIAKVLFYKRVILPITTIFLFISNETKHMKINNMRFMNLTMFFYLLAAWRRWRWSARRRFYTAAALRWMTANDDGSCSTKGRRGRWGTVESTTGEPGGWTSLERGSWLQWLRIWHHRRWTSAPVRTNGPTGVLREPLARGRSAGEGGMAAVTDSF
jgi:hypothetical protein